MTVRTSALELQRAGWVSPMVQMTEWDTEMELVRETAVRSAQKHPGCYLQCVEGGQDSSTSGSRGGSLKSGISHTERRASISLLDSEDTTFIFLLQVECWQAVTVFMIRKKRRGGDG